MAPLVTERMDPDVIVLTVSFSFAILGAVLLFRKFDAYFGIMCLLIAIFGYFYPGVLIAPYFMVVWRVLLGQRIRTDAKLLIGQKRGDRDCNNIGKPEDDVDPTSDQMEASSNSLSHWIVAVGGNSEDYSVIHAVGNVVSGKGNKKFKLKYKALVEQDYILHHVGWVTRRERTEHMVRVQEHEPMASSYSCQEYAVDIAFQISCSRTYTYIKCLTLARVRTGIYLFIMCFGGLIFTIHKFTDQAVIVLVPINPYFFNPMMITNVFIAMEAYRLGYTNLRQERHLWGGLKDRLNVYFRVISYMDFFKLFVILAFSLVVQIWISNTMLTLGILMVTILVAKV